MLWEFYLPYTKLAENYFLSIDIISCSITALELLGVVVDNRDSILILQSINSIT